MTTTAPPPQRAIRYTTGAILLHWAIALLIILQIAGGLMMTGVLPEDSALRFDIFQLHKSLGVSVLILTMARIAWRLFNPPPPEPASVSKLEGWVSGAVHLAFYGLMLAIPLTGWILISVSTINVDTVLFFSPYLPWPHLPGFADLGTGAKAALEDAAAETHELLAYAIAGLLLLHVAGALKHQFADGVFIGRMWPFSGPARRAYGHVSTVVVTVLFAGIVIGGATLSRQAQAPAAAPDTAAAPEAAAPASADTVTRWAVRPAESTLGFTATVNGRPAEGGFASWSADIAFDPEDLDASSIDVAIDLTSATIDSSTVSNAQLTGSDGFDSKNVATARFAADTIRHADDGAGYVADGTLTLRGISQPVALPFTVTIENDVARAAGHVTIDRTAYDVGTNLDAQGGTVAKMVTVTLDIVADRKVPTSTAEQ